MASADKSDARDWLQPTVEQGGVQRFAEVVRERIWIILAIAALFTGLAAVYSLQADEVYEAEADIQVNPLAADPTTQSLPLIREQADPAIAVETVAQLITTPDVAEAARTELESSRSVDDLLADVRAEPVSQSNIVGVVAQGPTPEAAAALANAVATAAVDRQSEQLKDRIDEILPRLRNALEGSPGASSGVLAEQIAEFQVLRASPNPNLSVQTLATEPESPIAPRPVLIIGAGLLLGLVLGIAIAFGSRQLDPRLRREEQLQGMFRLPILARVPRENVSGDGAIAPSELSPQAREAYRTLRATLTGGRARRKGCQVILVTGPAPSEGKTTTAINVALLLALSGSRTILMESDLRRPAIGRTFGVSPDRGVVSYLLGQNDLEESLTTLPVFGSNLQMLLADHLGAGLAELFSLPIAEDLLEDTRGAADYVVIDSPPLTDVIDTLPLAKAADDVLIVTHLGKSPLRRIKQLGELLADNEIKPAGFALLGVPRERGYYYASPSSSSVPASTPVG